MAYTQLITPNPNVPCQPGWCLKYVQDTFGIAPRDPTATAAWNASSTKHQDQNFPDGVWVPLWFALKYEPAGHVVLRAPDGSIYSSSHPTSTTPTHHAGLAALIAYYANANPLTYLGWTEDVEGVNVISQDGDNIMIADTDNEYGRWQRLAYQIRGRSFSREEFRNSAVGRTWLNAMEILSDDAESDAATHAQEVGQTAVRDNWEGQIHGLVAQVNMQTAKSNGLATNLNDATLALDAANRQLTTDKAAIADLSKQLNDARAAQTKVASLPTTEPEPMYTATEQSATFVSLGGRLVAWLRSILSSNKN